MSVNNVNSLYQTQGVQGSTSYTTLSQDDGGGVDIGKLLLGGLGTVVTIGLGVAAYKSGKQSSLTKEGDNMFQTMLNGIKSWFGKNGDDVAEETLEKLRDKDKTTLKNIFSGNNVTQVDFDDLYEHRTSISEFIKSGKVKNNAEKLDAVKNLQNLVNDNTLEASDDAVTNLNRLVNQGGKRKDLFKLVTDSSNKKSIQLIDNADEALLAKANKMGLIEKGELNSTGVDEALNKLKTSYTQKHKAYQTYSNKIENSESSSALKALLSGNIKVSSTSTSGVEISAKNMKTLFTRYDGEVLKINDISTPNSFILAKARLGKYHQAGSLTNDEYNNLMALAENKFAQNKNEYIKYMTKGLTDADGNPITITSTTKLTEKHINALHKKYPTLNLEKEHTLTAENLLTYSQNQHNDIASFLGIQGKTLNDLNGFKISGDKLIWRSSKSSPSAPEKIFGKDIKTNCTTTNEGTQTTQIQITLEQLKTIFPATT